MLEKLKTGLLAVLYAFLYIPFLIIIGIWLHHDMRVIKKLGYDPYNSD